MVRAWRCADHDELSAFLFEDFTDPENQSASEKAMLDELQQRLFTERNVVMANGVEQFIRSGNGTYFVVVGSGHLLGPDSVVGLLRAKGYEVNPVRLPARQ
jgi:uncharacterized protein